MVISSYRRGTRRINSIVSLKRLTARVSVAWRRSPAPPSSISTPARRFRSDGYLFVPPGDSQDQLDRELEAAHRAGLSGVEKIARAPIEHFDTGPALRFPRQGQFHPLKYLSALARAITLEGGRIFIGAHAEQFIGGRDARVVTDDHKTVRCSNI